MTVQRLMDVPGFAGREPGTALLESLRVIDARAEVVYVGEGRWWVGRVKIDSARRSVGRKMVVRIMEGDGFPEGEERHAAMRQAKLMSQGFGLIAEVRVQGDPDGAILLAFRRAIFAENGGVVEDPEAIAEESARRDRIRENKVREREMYKWLFHRSAVGRGNAFVGFSRPTERPNKVILEGATA